MIRYNALFKALGSRCEIQIFHQSEEDAENLVEQALCQIQTFNDRYSRFLSSSIVSKINSMAGREPVKVDRDTARLLDIAHLLHERSEGLFDATSGVLRRVWQLPRSVPPSAAELSPLLELVHWSMVQWDPPYIFLPVQGMEIDFGGFGKEFLVDLIASFLSKQGVEHGLVNLGGDVRAIGPKPDGEPWTIGITHPDRPLHPIASRRLSRGSLATSGDYERHVTINNIRYSHLLNPRTGYPVNGLRSVTVHGAECLWAGASATIAMLKGPDQALDYLTECGSSAMVVTADLTLYSTGSTIHDVLPSGSMVAL